MKKILFNDIRKSGNYLKHFEYLFSDYDLFRKKHFSNLCLQQLQPLFPDSKLLLTHSATGGLEMIALLLNIQPGDEVIMPSFTFVSTVNAFVSHGATPVFVDINPMTLNIDVDRIESEITDKTKAIVAVHYAGHACDLVRLGEICKNHDLYLIEDAAMAFGNQFDDVSLGGYGDFGVISFDITKQISAVQGGLLIVNNPAFTKRAEDIYNIGTNRAAFMKGTKPYYEWVDVGSKFQMNELSAVVLYEYLLETRDLLSKRNKLSFLYFEALRSLADKDFFRLINEKKLKDNYHEFYMILESESVRDTLVKCLSDSGIEALFHYIPLHNSSFGKRMGRSGDLKYSEEISARLLRLPLHPELTEEDVLYICEKIKSFFDERN